MNIYFALILNFLPLFICFFSFRFLFRMKFSTELFACLFGLLSVLPGTFLQFYLGCFVPEQIFSAKNGLAGIFCNFFVYNGLVEELIKLVMIALITVFPAATRVTFPPLTVATAVSVEFHVAELVTSSFVPSE